MKIKTVFSKENLTKISNCQLDSSVFSNCGMSNVGLNGENLKEQYINAPIFVSNLGVENLNLDPIPLPVYVGIDIMEKLLMSDLLNTTPAARNWVDEAIRRHSNSIFEKLAPAVIWTDARGDDNELLVPVDPIKLVADINNHPYILLHNHDPGKPKGQILESANFANDGGVKFIVAVLGYYADSKILNFRELGHDTKALVPPPQRLPELPDDIWIEFATDPRDVDRAWVHMVTSDAPLRIELTELSHNAANSSQELIRVGLVYLAIVWNPFITSIASEAEKDTYAAIHAWIRKLLAKLEVRCEPILEITSYQNDCQVSFLFRGNNVRLNYAAHDKLSNAAAQAAQLVVNLEARGTPGRQLNYEFDKEALRWFPSFAILSDGRIVVDCVELIAIEQLPAGLSMGLNRKFFG